MTCRKRVLERVGPATARLLRRRHEPVQRIGSAHFLPGVCGGAIYRGACMSCGGVYGSRSGRPVNVVR